MSDEVNRFQISFQTIYNGEPWYGDSVQMILQEIPVNKAFLKSGSAHSIAEIVAHLISWRVFLLKRLSGDEKFEVKTDDTFRWEAYGASPGQAWGTLLQELDRNQKTVLELIGKLQPHMLSKRVSGRNHTFRELIEGVIQHDLYHLGQIALLRKHFTQ